MSASYVVKQLAYAWATIKVRRPDLATNLEFAAEFAVKAVVDSLLH